MNYSYIEQFRNRNIKPALLRSENIQALEEILNQKIITYSKFKKEVKKGRIPKRKELCLLLKEIKPEVDKYLGVSTVDFPTVDYTKVDYSKYYERLVRGTVLPMLSIPLFLAPLDNIGLYPRLFFGLPMLLMSSLGTKNIIKKIIEEEQGLSVYNFIDKSITLERQSVYDLIPTLAHEYAHHVQNEKKIPKKEYFSFLNEGQARSVQRHISVNEWIKNDDFNFMLGSLDYDLSELRATYMWLTKYFKKNATAFLTTEAMTERGQFDLKYVQTHRTPTPHALGNAFFSLLEAREGTEIHKEIMAGRYQLPSFQLQICNSLTTIH